MNWQGELLMVVDLRGKTRRRGLRWRWEWIKTVRKDETGEYEPGNGIRIVVRFHIEANMILIWL